MVIYRDLSVELTAFNVTITVDFHQHDTAWSLRCLLFYDGNPFPLKPEDTCVYKFNLPDGSPFELQAKLDAENPSMVIFDIPPAVTETPGTACGEIHLSRPDGRRLHSPRIRLRIDRILVK